MYDNGSLDLEYFKTKKKLKDIKKLKRMIKTQNHITERLHKAPVHIVFTDIIDSICMTFENIVKR